MWRTTLLDFQSGVEVQEMETITAKIVQISTTFTVGDTKRFMYYVNIHTIITTYNTSLP